MNERYPTTNINTLNGDQIVWLEDVLTRFAQAVRAADHYPAISRHYHAARLAAILELMEITGMQLEPNSGAYHNLLRYVQPPIAGGAGQKV